MGLKPPLREWRVPARCPSVAGEVCSAESKVGTEVARRFVDGWPCVADVGEVEIVVLALVLVVNADGGLLCVMRTPLTVARQSAT